MKIKTRSIFLFVGALALLFFALVGVTPGFAQDGGRDPSYIDKPASPTSIATQDLTGALTPTDLANQLAGSGVTISNVTFSGVDIAAGTFSGGTGIIGFESGVMLSSGDIANAVGPNMDDGITAINGTPGDPDLDVLAGVATFDAVILEFDFVPAGDTVSFNYVFSSDEYNENVGSSVNDSFGFFVNGVNCATVNGLPVSINTINNGNPYDTDPRSNPSFYINNDLSDGGGSLDTEMDGLTVVLTCNASVTPGSTNHIKLAIADGGDNALDSNVFLEAGSFTIPQPPQPIPEPLTMGLFGSGLAALGAYVHKRRKAGEKAA